MWWLLHIREKMEEERSMVLARVAERAERFDEMADFMKERVEKGTPLNSDERDMFSAAFKNALTERRHAVRVAVSVADQQRIEGREDKAALALGYKSKVEAELSGICDKALKLLKNILVPAASDGEAKTFYLKMTGDYYRYMAEVAEGEVKKRAAEDAKVAYEQGMAEASRSLSTIHPVRMGLALNFSVFQHEVLGETQAAKATAQMALQQAADSLAEASEDCGHDVDLTIQLLQDNLSLWEY